MHHKQRIVKCARCRTPEAAPPGPPFMVCASCKRAHYCGRPCQLEHWPSHKEECRANAVAAATLRNDAASKARFSAGTRWIASNEALMTAIVAAEFNGRDPKCHVVIMKVEQTEASFRVTEIQSCEDGELGEEGQLATALRKSRRSEAATTGPASALYARLILDIACSDEPPSRTARFVPLELDTGGRVVVEDGVVTRLVCALNSIHPR